MTAFEFATAGRILFGEGRAGELGAIARDLGRRALLVQGSSARAGKILEDLRREGIGTVNFRVAGEPDVEGIGGGVQLAREEQCDLVIAIGGGSVIDAGKAIAALLTNPGDPLRYLEVVGEGQPLQHPPAPFIALPTTAGTGAEVTRNAVLAVPEERVKVSLRSPLMLPRVALIDPELTYSLPPAITASTGMDALTQCIEPFVTSQATPLTDGLAREGLRRGSRMLLRAFTDGEDVEARREMAVASLCGGLALANAKLGAVHGIAGPLGGMAPVPHGTACARLLAPVMEMNLRALRSRGSGAPALGRYGEVARILTDDPDALPEAGAAWVRDLVEELQIPPLSAFGVDEELLPELIPAAQRASSMRGNPVELTAAELEAVVRAAIEGERIRA